ncbi:CRE-ADT-1 protein [Aphelenchoides avenae]|nr:CRE-ADT-1 protein [Aphelenchus avenae]
MGVIVTDEHFLVLQTLPERIKNYQVRSAAFPFALDGRQTGELFQDEQHLVYKRESGLINPLEHFVEEHVKVELNEDSRSTFGHADLAGAEFCDVKNSVVQVNYTIPTEAKLDSLFVFPQLDPITLEIGLFLDSKLYEHFSREFTSDPDQHLTDFSLALINNVHVLYQQPTLSPNLEIVIVRFEMWKTQPPALATHLHKNGQAQTLLDSFCRHQARINPGTDLTDPGHWDHGVLLTGFVHVG